MLAVIMLAWHRGAATHSASPLLLPPPGLNQQISANGTFGSGQSTAASPSHEEEPLPVPRMPGEWEDFAVEPDAGEIELSTPIYPPGAWAGAQPWDTGVELGINGSSGTSESLSIRAGGYVKRESRFSQLDLKSYYNHTTESGNATQNNAVFEVRNDWLLDERSPWTLYGTGEVFYDEFQAFDVQTSTNTGIGYRFVHDPELDVIGRLGAGASREVGGPDDRWVPESLLGFEYNQQLSATQRFYGKLDYYPEWDEIGEFRLVADTGWQIQFAQPSNLSLKVCASDRYDSTPHGAQPHLVNYSVLLLLRL
jgi:hypothetical protein